MDDKLNIIEQIEQLRNNKQYIQNDEYDYRLELLHKKLSDCISKLHRDNNIEKNNKHHIVDVNIRDNILYNIKNNCINVQDVLNLKNIKKLIYFFPLFELYLIENNFINNTNKIINIQQEPIIDAYSKQDMVLAFGSILHLSAISNGYQNKVITILILYDIIFKNFQFILDHKYFFCVVKKKILEINSIASDVEKINNTLIKYNLDVNIFNKWTEILTNTNIDIDDDNK
jgi:hypothetical protein